MKITETIYFDDRELTVTGYYTPEEPQVRYYTDGSGYPGSPSEFDIELIEVDDVGDMTDYYLKNSDEIIELVIKQIEDEHS